MSTSGPAHRVSSAVVEYGYPQGHLGHLTEDEQTAFHDFKALCAEKGYYKPAQDGHPESHDDATLLRFLRARRFIATDALKQFHDTEEWRKANEIDKLYETIDLSHYEETRRLYPQWTGRRDRRGIPVYVYEVKHLNSKTMSAYEKSAVKTNTLAKNDGKTSPKLLRLFALYENLTRFVMPLCTALDDRDHATTPITQSNNIVDISGVGLKQFWNLRSHMQDASTLATAHYPETLDRIFIIGAPAFFPTVWGWIKKWFDPITTSKIFILSSSDMKHTLESFIDPANIPKKYGGELDFQFGDQPVLDTSAFGDNIEWHGTNTGFPPGPMYWVNMKGDMIEGVGVEGEEVIEAIAVGTSESGEQRKERICTLRRNVIAKIPSTGAYANGNAITTLHPELLTAPTEIELVPGTAVDTDSTEETNTAPDVKFATAPALVVYKGENEKLGVQNGEVVNFITASEGIKTLSLDEKSNEKPAEAEINMNGNSTHIAGTPHKLDTAVSAGV